MPKIRCLYEECIFLSKGFCTAASIELDPEDDIDDYDDTWEDEGYEEIDLDEDEY